MSEQERFYKIADNILRYIDNHRYRYVHISEVKKEFETILEKDEIISGINYLAKCGYVNLVNAAVTQYINCVSSLNGDVLIKINLSGLKKRYMY